jgi:hypothetical protein
VTAADLVDELSGPGPLTVFAPTNNAFALLLTELGVTKAELLANKPQLTAVLTYHVVPAKILKADVPLGKAISTVQGDIFKVDAVDAELAISEGRNRQSKITATDVTASNCVIHVIDKVLLPADKNIVETALAAAPSSAFWSKRRRRELAGRPQRRGPVLCLRRPAPFAALLTELNVTGTTAPTFLC